MSIAEKGETVLITGATAGIGYEMSKLFAINGYNLVIVARNQSQLQQLQQRWQDEFGVTIHAIEKDLSHQSSVEEIVDYLEKHNIEIDILINNAGFGLFGPFIETPIEQELKMIQVNIVALTQLTKHLIPNMIRKKKGKILNVASIAAFQSGPLMAVYYATKAYVLSFSEALTNELADHGVLVSVLCPGPTSTQFEKRANLKQSKLSRRNLMYPEEVAKIAFRQFMKGKTLIVPGATNWILVRSSRLLPRKMVTGIVRKIQNERGK